ncbi:MAG: VWA domain-containing protein, partial [Deltaproteobacteria bacterium]|nr:VWA domain-containing protein [Deltaproteobacteria bacterium]
PDEGAPTSLFAAQSSAGPRPLDLPTGWDAATAWRRLQGNLPEGPVRQEVRERAIKAVIDRARHLLRHAARPMRRETVGWPEEGDLDLEETLERPRPWTADDLRVDRRVPRDADVVAVLDMSLSMTGEKIALVAVATAILSLRLEHVSVVAFDTVPHALVRAGERVALREVVRRVLEVPAQGYTNIEGGLLAGAEQLRRGRHRERVGMLFTDGVANVGRDPVTAAHRYPRLHVVHVGEHHPQGARACLAMARAGHGKLYRARAYQDLPGVVRTAVRELFRG